MRRAAERQIERDAKEKTRVHMNYVQTIRVRRRIHYVGVIKIIINMCEYLYIAKTIMQLMTYVYDRASTCAKRETERERKRPIR